MRLVVNCASTCANQTSGSAGQKGGSLMETAEGVAAASGRAGSPPSSAMLGCLGRSLGELG